MQGFKYISYEAVLDELNKNYPDDSWSKNKVHDWCAQMEIEIMRHVKYFVIFQDAKFPVKNKRQFELPCTATDIKDIRKSDNKTRVKILTQMGKSIHFTKPIDDEFVYVDFRGAPVDQDGNVLILASHIRLCEKYCVKQEYRPRFYKGELPQQVWQDIEFEFSAAMDEAEQSLQYYTAADYDEVEKITTSLLPTIGRQPQYKEGI